LTRRALLTGFRPRASVFLGAALALACATAARPPARPPAPSRVLAPELALSDGLDVAVRVDIAALGAELGQAPAREFLLDALSLGDSERATQLLGRSLDRAALLWFGLPMPRASAASSVLVLRGHFSDLAEEADWSRRDSGVEQLELDAGNPGYARVYRLPGDEQLLWAPSDELPSVERAIAGSVAEAALRPPERGAVSIAARPAGVLERAGARYPELTEHFRGVRRIEAFAEPTAGMWRADLTLDFDTATQAADASAVLERLRQTLAERRCAIGVVARAVAVTRFERDVRVQTVLIGPELEAVKACVLGEGCCA